MNTPTSDSTKPNRFKLALEYLTALVLWLANFTVIAIAISITVTAVANINAKYHISSTGPSGLIVVLVVVVSAIVFAALRISK